jgi:phage antirepressor YoqD-like protein
MEVSENVVDPDLLKIIAFTVQDSHTVKEISEAMGIPLAKAYNLIDWMEEHGLLVEVGKVRTALHGHATRYISTVKSGSIELQNNRLVIKCVHKDGCTKVCDTYLISRAETE